MHNRKGIQATKTPDYHVGASLFGEIYAGTLTPKKDEKNGKTQGGYEWKHKDGKKVKLIVKVADEMMRRGYEPNKIWRSVSYRGKELGFEENWCDPALVAACVESKENCLPRAR